MRINKSHLQHLQTYLIFLVAQSFVSQAELPLSQTPCELLQIEILEVHFINVHHIKGALNYHISLQKFPELFT